MINGCGAYDCRCGLRYWLREHSWVPGYARWHIKTFLGWKDTRPAAPLETLPQIPGIQMVLTAQVIRRVQPDSLIAMPVIQLRANDSMWERPHYDDSPPGLNGQ